MIFRKATFSDIENLVEIRLNLLRASNNLPDDADLTFVREQLYQYLQETMLSGEHISIIAENDGIVLGIGGISFYCVMPTYNNPTGKKAYITNMYTIPEYRHHGIATKILDALVQESLSKEVLFISLEATPMGRRIYEKYGFIPMHREMQLNNEAHDPLD